VLVSVYHVGGLLLLKPELDDSEKKNADQRNERELLERHFRTVADLTAVKILYPVTGDCWRSYLKNSNLGLSGQRI
jgi:hypothetical protein